MPLEVQISTKNYTFEQLNLPYENQDFDFETIKKFDEQTETDEKGKNVDDGKPGRKRSNDSIINQAGLDGADKKGLGAPSMISTSKHQNEDHIDY